jgi:hypothetical protein
MSEARTITALKQEIDTLRKTLELIRSELREQEQTGLGNMTRIELICACSAALPKEKK